ncbi:MAG: thiamine-phosphate pyrophosphorylase [Candidatus Omnitrophica bacterium]|nr:thiamine-phosphate pyrophosphorylase [Candidatus Omnitrophota bacterium]
MVNKTKQTKNDKKLLRVIDVNFNRSKEGLRVVEDAFRFVIENRILSEKLKEIRHSLDHIIEDRNLIKKLLTSRDTKSDFGKEINNIELNRKNLFDIIYVNFQRTKESLRVLEELFKIVDKRKVATVKKLRYEIYDIEKESFKEISSLYNS